MSDAKEVVVDRWKMVIRYPIKGKIEQILFEFILYFI